jgi:dTDP-4-amino-4,6-dideoxygalactose transaminase
MRTIPFGRPIIGKAEKQAVMEVLSGHLLTHGPRVKEFEQVFARFTGAEYAVATASCTASLHLAYFYLGLKPGDEVIVPAQTHVATAHAVELCGAVPVFVDAEAQTGNLDLEQLPAAITPRTRAIAVVHYLGLPVDMARLMAIARQHGLFVVEDCALAIGSYYQGVHAGLWGDVGCFSFYPVKHLTTAEGGMVITRHRQVAETIAKQRAFGIDRNVVSERPIPGLYDVELLGFNYRLNEIGAALGLAQMQRLEGFLNKRRENYGLLREGLAGVQEVEFLRSSQPGTESSYYCFSLLLKEPWHQKRFAIMEFLKQRGIGTSIYYPRPVPHMEYYRRKYGYGNNSFPVAARLSANAIALPVGPHVEADDIHYMLATIKEALAEVT